MGVKDSNSHMNGIRAFAHHLAVDDESGTSTRREARGGCWIGMTLPATDDHGRRHSAKRASAIEVSRQNVNESLAPEVGVLHCENIERCDSYKRRVELDGWPQASNQRAPQQEHTQNGQLRPQSPCWTPARVRRYHVKRLRKQAIHPVALRHPGCGCIGCRRHACRYSGTARSRIAR